MDCIMCLETGGTAQPRNKTQCSGRVCAYQAVMCDACFDPQSCPLCDTVGQIKARHEARKKALQHDPAALEREKLLFERQLNRAQGRKD
eukprot:CAMPEP_0197700430 /NCGR_PEP_ID=MMETSP1338-20131121/121971_1 /TAXON_ID=43686 ORGANISM="Pelagodinium beii, Strain RCC1491" /NCGR_SAMPLE_ID=MMETSP1338 /ASSEMBLY_ACC=CAM_ASM_000754 /LENGTH=88 /DNA_ID=CAMNT_0043284041 /DNA_START=1 /DNA_END=267 /DNA_ORIENTATION=-